MRSPPSRGAWIEIEQCAALERDLLTSPPSRGAWIEMTPSRTMMAALAVAPLAGGVD